MFTYYKVFSINIYTHSTHTYNTYIYTHASIYTYICIYIYRFTYTHLYMYTFMYTYIHIYIYILITLKFDTGGTKRSGTCRILHPLRPRRGGHTADHGPVSLQSRMFRSGTSRCGMAYQGPDGIMAAISHRDTTDTTACVLDTPMVLQNLGL